MCLRARVTRILAAAGLVLVTSAVPIARVAACDCMMMAPEEAAAAADVAFTGTVVAEQPVAADGRGGVGFADLGEMLYAFEVDGVAKGDVAATAQVLSGGDGASCGMAFGIGERWLIFGTVERDTITTHLCSGNVALAPEDPGPIAVSPPQASATPERGPSIPPAILLPALAVAALAAASAFLFWRADRPS